jgi:hypothetical protein
MRIPIPENNILFGDNATVFDSFAYMQLWLERITANFNRRFNIGAVNSPDCMEATIILKTVQNFNTLYNICCTGKDYSAGCTISRTIADNVAVLNLVYFPTDEEEREYRHYLYLLDGLRIRANLLADNATNNGHITDSVYEALCTQIKEAREDTNKVIAFCEDKLSKHRYASTYTHFHNLVVKNAVWQFKEVGKIGKKDVSKYKWEELYERLDNRPTIVSMYSKFLSQFVHGLSVSNIVGQCVFENFEAIMAVAVTLQGQILNELKSRFNKNGELLKEITLDDLSTFLSMYRPEKRDEIIKQIQDYANSLKK